jgi:Surface glycan-binding protein B xyloglucan binding domain
MKTKHKFFIPILITTMTAGLIWSCSEDLPFGGEPTISYVRITNPASSDSLLVAAGQGQMIAIVGANLGDVRQLWFNDQRTSLNPVYITDRSIIVRVPSTIPNEVTNQMRLIFGNGKELLHNFLVDISEPEISYIKSEFVNTGDIAIIHGNYFYAPLAVTFAGGVVGEIVMLDEEVIEVRVPSGALPGPITITSNFGETESDFWFRDNRNVVASFDGTTNGLWHGPNYITAGDETMPAISGKYIRMNKTMNAWDWYELYVGPANSDAALELKNIPQEAFTNPGKYLLKFEINTLASLTGANIHMYIGPNMASDRNSTNYNWQPNINTEGKWETVSIPWTDVYLANKEFVFNPNGYGISVHFSGPNAFNGSFGLDNMRVVPNDNSSN